LKFGIIIFSIFVATPYGVIAQSSVEPIVSNFNIPTDSYDYNRMFKYSRDLLTRKPVQDLLKEVFAEQLKVDPKIAKLLNIPVGGIKELSEHQFILLLQMNKDIWPMLDQYIVEVPDDVKDSAKFAAIRKDWHDKFLKILEDPKVKEKFIKYNNPLEPRILQTADQGPGYKNLEFYANTTLKYQDGKTIPPSNLKQKWIDFIKKAQKQIVLNVYDFDLTDVADELVAASKRGVDIRVGIDQRNVTTRPEVKAIFDQLAKNKNIKVFSVNSVGLNHQKICARDWELPGKGAVLASSGNLTQSCSGPEGDGIGKIKSKFSIPNANHLVMMDSDVTSQLVNHELTKTLDMGLRGNEYPLSGTWMVLGDGKNIKPADRNYFEMAFSPNGALGDINDQIIGSMIRDRKGELKTLQFAFSSQGVDDALYEAATSEIKKTGKFNFRSVGDTPFADREWSVFLDMIGYEKDPKTGIYKINNKDKWNQLPESVKAQLRATVKAAPDVYGTHTVDLSDGTKLELTSKIHNKVMMDDEKGFFGTSFNFSENAEGNNETIIMFKDKKIIKDGQAMFEGLYDQSDKTLEQVILEKNKFPKNDPLVGSASSSEDGFGEGKNCSIPMKSILNAIKQVKK